MSFHTQAYNDFYSYLCNGGTMPAVKRYEPRMFMGKEVPEGATHYIVEDGDLVFFRLNSVAGLCVHFCNINGSQWVHYRNTKYPHTVVYELIKLTTQEKNIMKKDFTKADLKTGMKIVLRNKMKYIVMLDVDGCDLLTNKDYGLMRLDCYLEDLKCEAGSDPYSWDIVEVYQAHSNSYALDTNRLETLIWKREEKSPEQIAYEQLQAQIADEEIRHNDSMKALREQAEKLKPKGD